VRLAGRAFGGRGDGGERCGRGDEGGEFGSRADVCSSGRLGGREEGASGTCASGTFGIDAARDGAVGSAEFRGGEIAIAGSPSPALCCLPERGDVGRLFASGALGCLSKRSSGMLSCLSRRGVGGLSERGDVGRLPMLSCLSKRGVGGLSERGDVGGLPISGVMALPGTVVGLPASDCLRERERERESNVSRFGGARVFWAPSTRHHFHDQFGGHQ
jgi:hypothetical protein